MFIEITCTIYCCTYHTIIYIYIFIIEMNMGYVQQDGLTESRFLEEFRTRYLCTAPVTMTSDLMIKGGKTVRKVDINEVLEGLEAPDKVGSCFKLSYKLMFILECDI